MVHFGTIVVALALVAQAPAEPVPDDESRPFAIVAQKEARCVLRDFADRPDGHWQGTRIALGRSVGLECSFYVESEVFRSAAGINTISAGGMVRAGFVPTYHSYHVAFFDADGNLIGCDGEKLPADSPIRGAGSSSVTRLMPIPKNIHKRIGLYKIAHFESSSPLGRVAVDEAEVLTEVSTDGNTGRKTIRTWPKWKSDGELREQPFVVRPGTRTLSDPKSDAWSAVTHEGTCTLRRAKDPDAAEAVAVDFGDKTGLQAYCRVFVVERDTLFPDRVGAIETWVRFANGSARAKHAALYVAFFDRFGNLVCCASEDATAKPNETDRYQRRATVMLPKGFEAKVTSYMATLYESDDIVGRR